MKNTSVLSAMLGIVCWASLSAADAATPSTPPAPGTAASAASAVAPGQTRRERASPAQSPAVRAAQGAVTPGELRPENPVVPQIAVPLRRPRDVPGSGRAGSAPGAIDDSAARCRAASNDRERAACIRSGNVSGTPPKR
jgi:hypothetical protein